MTPRSRAVAFFGVLGQCNAATRASLSQLDESSDESSGESFGAPLASVVVRAVVDVAVGTLRALVGGDAVAASTGTALHGCVGMAERILAARPAASVTLSDDEVRQVWATFSLLWLL